jgi:hypothetical protein
MAEPTIKDVLDAIARLEPREELADVRCDLSDTRRELADARRELDAKIDGTRRALLAKIDAHRAETRKGFEDLVEKLRDTRRSAARSSRTSMT